MSISIFKCFEGADQCAWSKNTCNLSAETQGFETRQAGIRKDLPFEMSFSANILDVFGFTITDDNQISVNRLKQCLILCQLSDLLTTKESPKMAHKNQS